MQPDEQVNPAGNGFSDAISGKNSELSRWVEHVTKQLMIEDNDDQPPPPTAEGAAVAAALLGELRPRKAAGKTIVEDMTTFLPHHHHQTAEPPGLNLLTLLLECAVAISVDNLGEARRMLLELTETASPYSSSCAERVIAYFAASMSSRVINSWIGVSAPLIDVKSVHAAVQVYNNISPFIKFAHFTSNQAILEAFHRRDRVHIIDLDIMQGLQWPALFHILATRPEGPPQVRMTGLGTDIDLLADTGKQLSNFARRLGMQFEFHPVDKKSGEINHLDIYASIRVGRDEAVAVHWMQHSLYDATGPDSKTMRLLQGLRPRVITLVEQEIVHGGSFLDRFVMSLHYYSTIFDSLGAFLPVDDPSRNRVEHCLLYREINNVLAIGGPARSGEDKFGHWRGDLSRNGFVQIPMSGNAMAQAQLIVNMFPAGGHGYSLVQGDGTLRLGWKETSLYTASAWTSPIHSSFR